MIRKLSKQDNEVVERKSFILIFTHQYISDL
jgi:hypothetical protein